jgi:hypothetical protein
MRPAARLRQKADLWQVRAHGQAPGSRRLSIGDALCLTRAIADFALRSSKGSLGLQVCCIAWMPIKIGRPAQVLGFDLIQKIVSASVISALCSIFLS